MPADPIDQADRLLASGRTEDAVQLVQRAAAAGSAEALLREAMWRLGGAMLPRDVPAARALLRRAAAAGQRDAAAIEIALTANGGGAAADWSGAVALLRALAQVDTAAAAELRLLESMRLTPDGHPLDQPEPRQVGTGPAVFHVPALFTAAECRHVAGVAQPMLAPATVVDPQTGRNTANPIRTSHAAVIGPISETLVIQALNRRIAAASRTDWRQGEALTVLRYEPGQQFRPHLDAIAGARNQRARTVLVYLNDGFEGGGTSFAASGLVLRPKAGDAIIFDNVRADGSVDQQAQHAGEVVTRGTKWLATRWIRARAFDPWRGPEAA